MISQDKRPIEHKKKDMKLFVILFIIYFPISVLMMCSINYVNKVVAWGLFIVNIIWPIYVGLRCERASRYPKKLKKKKNKNSFLDKLLPISGFLGVIVGKQLFNYFSINKGVAYEIMLMLAAYIGDILIIFSVTICITRAIVIKRWDKEYQNTETQA